jgi:transketolase
MESLLASDPRVMLLLGDIGVFGFRKVMQAFPRRVINIGILEAGTTSLAAGLAREGLIPVFHTIAPFLVERSLEQLKIDFCYQRLGGNFVSVGASYDYAALGCTHHCPADIPLLKCLPGMQIVVPGTAQELDQLLRSAYARPAPTYYRIAETTNAQSRPVRFGRAEVVRTGLRGTIVAVGPMLDRAMEAAEGFDVTILYYTTVAPFDSEALRVHCQGDRVLVVEPSYAGGLAVDVIEALGDRMARVSFAGVPREFVTGYGTREQVDEAVGLTVAGIRRRLLEMGLG